MSNTRNRGYILLATGASCVVLIGMLGLSVDLGRMYITKNEAQSFTDAAAVAAARELNGTLGGIAAAKQAVANSTNGWNMSTQLFTPANTVVKFALTKDGPWVADPAVGTNYGFVEVTATPNMNIFFLPIVGTAASQVVPARSVAGIVPATFPEGGYLPFTPFAHDPADPVHYGFRLGEDYAFLWPSNINKPNKACNGDREAWPKYNMSREGLEGEDHGYFTLGSASSIEDTILGFRQGLPLTEGQIIPLTNGRMQTVIDEMEALAARDTDRAQYPSNSSGQVPNYHGNGTRVVFMPVSQVIGGNAKILGFRAFLIPMDIPRGGTEAWCAIYLGSATKGGKGTSPYEAGAFVAKLLQ